MSWEQMWLNYKRKDNYDSKCFFEAINVAAEGNIIGNGILELKKAAECFFGITPITQGTVPCVNPPATQGTVPCVAKQGTVPCVKGITLGLCGDASLGAEGFLIKQQGEGLLIEGTSETGVLYGIFALIRRVQMDVPLYSIDIKETPDNPIMMINHWDNMDGSIERGYSGNSFFFENNEIIVNERTIDYARLMASVGVNALAINNVNVKGLAAGLITSKHYEKLAQLSQIFAGYGIKLYLSLNYASPIILGGLETADPLDAMVVEWWKGIIKGIYEHIPNFGGFLVKADSEGEPGPYSYNRDHAEGANMLASLVAPYNGIIIWRCFVYNCQQDWRDTVTDRAKAAYDNFMPLDGKFLDNVILQIKNGPMDFQVREPVTPLFGGLRKTHHMLEVQIAQEYTGHQIDVCYLVPSWKETLDFRTYMDNENDTVGDIVTGKAFDDTLCGFAAVANTGDQPNWTSHDLAAANLYGFGRLAWDIGLSSEEIAKEWAVLTFANIPAVTGNIVKILMDSWPAYEKYTSPLGTGWMINPIIHYGPNVDGYEYDKWGTYHRADHNGIGVDRSSRGTGYASQYNAPNARIYDNIDTCPDELLLFFHYATYGHVLKTGKTVIQHIYDSHFEGAGMVDEFIKRWMEIKDMIDPIVYERVLERFNRQMENSMNWRDTVNTYFYRKSMIPDAHGRKIYT